MLRAIKVRLYPNKNQKNYINNLIGSYRLTYNLALDYKKSSYDKDKSNINLTQLGKKFHGEWLKSNEYNFLNEHNTKVLKQSLIDMLNAYNLFFKKNNSYPKFKSKHSASQSVRFPLESISKRNDYTTNKLTLNKQLKNIKFKTSKKYIKYLEKHKAEIRSATLSKNKSGKYYLSILVDGDLIRKVIKTPINKSIGIDLGIKDFVITSKGDTKPNIKSIRNNEISLKKLHRNLSRKKNGSRNKNKARIKLAKKHEKIKEIFNGYQFEFADKTTLEKVHLDVIFYLYENGYNDDYG